MINRVILLGRNGAKPELRFTQSGAPVLNFSVATSKKIQNEYRTTWHRVIAWSKLAEYLSTAMDRGSTVYVEGEIENREWTDKQGNKKQTCEVLAQVVRILDKASPLPSDISSAVGPNIETGSSGSVSDQAQVPPYTGNGLVADLNNEDIPF